MFVSSSPSPGSGSWNMDVGDDGAAIVLLTRPDKDATLYSQSLIRYGRQEGIDDPPHIKHTMHKSCELCMITLSKMEE